MKLGIDNIGERFNVPVEGVSRPMMLVDIKESSYYFCYLLSAYSMELHITKDLTGITTREVKEKLSSVEREITSLRNDFQNLETLFHSTIEGYESHINSLEDEIKNKKL